MVSRRERTASGVLLKCPECNTNFVCGVNADACWCQDLPVKVVSETVSADCVCSDCLNKRTPVALEEH